MSKVTSSAYPVVTVSQAGDQFTIVQGGQFKKLTRQGLADFIATLAPNTFISLTDAPGSYVGQQGKAAVVNSTEDGLAFEATTAGNFLALSDTPGSYGGNANKYPRVNGAETALEFVDDSFIQHVDTPASYAGQALKVPRVNAAANALEFVDQSTGDGNFFGGYYAYSHGGGTQSYTGGSGPLVLQNDALGAQTQLSYGPPTVPSVWDSTLNQFDFSNLNLGDMVDIRVALTVTTTAVNQVYLVNLNLGVGATPYNIQFGDTLVKSASTRGFGRYNGIYIGNALTKDNPAQITFESDDDATIQVDGWYVKIVERGTS